MDNRDVYIPRRARGGTLLQRSRNQRGPPDLQVLPVVDHRLSPRHKVKYQVAAGFKDAQPKVKVGLGRRVVRFFDGDDRNATVGQFLRDRHDPSSDPRLRARNRVPRGRYDLERP